MINLKKRIYKDAVIFNTLENKSLFSQWAVATCYYSLVKITAVITVLQTKDDTFHRGV